MKNLKKHASLSTQVQLLQKRGLIIQDTYAAERTLRNINYYRLSGYLHNFKQTNSNQYIENLTWERLKRIYDFDRKFTRVLMYALEDIEETFKTRLSYTITRHYPNDPTIYLKPPIYRDYNSYMRFVALFYREKEKNSELPFIKHHDAEYGGMLPFWVAVELFTMGNLQAIYRNLISRYQKELAKSYQTGPRQLASWIENLTYTRNHLAHYMRIYNFNFGRTPAKCSNHKRTYKTTGMIFDQVYVISCMYSDRNEWTNYVVPEIRALIEEYQDAVELSGLGFPEDWESILL